MRRIILIVFLISMYNVHSQNLNYQNELERMIKIPKTPEAEAFAKYGNTSVNMYSGTPTVSIPIYTISGRELDLPISLTYDASGVKVSQLASQVGLNWNLNVGGRVSRTINGMVDDYFYIAPASTSYTSVYSNSDVYVEGVPTGKTLRELILENLNPPQTFPSQSAAENYFKFLKEISDNKLDTQPDYFSFNALGNNDNFVYVIDSLGGSFQSLDNPRTKVSATFDATNTYITSWTVVTEDGTKFYFNQAEKTSVENLNDIVGTVVLQDYYSSWLLTKIESPNLKDVYEFTYSDLGLSETQPNLSTKVITNEMSNPNPEWNGSITYQDTNYKISQLALTKITHNNRVVVDLTLKSRFDFSLPSAISKIDIYKYDGSSVLKTFLFNHSYFGIVSGADPKFQSPFSIRLKLDSITIKSGVSTSLYSYKFDYFSPESVPSRDSYGIDYLGLYNGKSNSVLYPSVTVNGVYFSGADRSPDFNKAIIGTLKTLTYPTGGYTEFTYEPNKTTYTLNDVSETVHDVTYGSLSVSGGVGNGADCGNCCLDQYGSPPNNNSVLFNITEPGNYRISYTNTGGGDSEAYLFLRSSIQNFTPELNYNQVIDQSNCAVLVPMTWTNFSGYNDDSVYLTPGTYQITLVKGYFTGGSGTISLSVHREETISSTIVGTGEVARAGIRIKNIKDYRDVGVLSLEKEYQYTTTLNGANSSGEILFQPSFYTISNYQVYIDQPDLTKGQVMGLNTLTRMTRVGSWSGGSRPHIAYTKVYEIQKSGGVNNGYVEYYFNTGWYNGIFSTGITPSVNLYRNDFSTGKKWKSNVYNRSDELLKTEVTEYTNTRYFGNSTLYIYNNIYNSYSYVDIYPDGTGKYRYKYTPAIFIGFNGPYAPGSSVNASHPNSCTYCLPTLDYSSLETRQTYAQGNTGGVLTEESTMYYNGVASTQSTINTYGNVDIDYLLRETATINSKGESLITKQYYPKDFPAIPYTTLVSNNRLTEVIQTETFKKTGTNPEQKLFTRKNEYIDTSKGIFPNEILAAKATDILEGRIRYGYSDGNVVEASQLSGDNTETHTSYIWGYDKSLPIAKLENIKYADIPSSTILNLQAASDNDVDEVTEQILRTELNNLRLQFPNVKITTFTFDPHVGIKSMTDPKGQVFYYHYDEFNRLEFVIDSEGKVLSKNQYNFRTN